MGHVWIGDDVMKDIGELHNYLILAGFDKISGISPPRGNQLPISALKPEDMILYFIDSATEEEKAQTRNFLNSLDLSLSYLPDVDKLQELILADNRLKPSVKSAITDLKDKILPVINDKDYIQSFWADFKSNSDTFSWLNPKVAAIVEIHALSCNIPLVDVAPNLDKVADVDAFVATVLSSQEMAPYLIEMSQALSILGAQIGDSSKVPLMQAFWGALKVKTGMDSNVVKIIEDAALQYNIPIIDLGA